VPLERWQFEDAWAFLLPMPPGRTEIFRRLLAAHDVRVAHFQHFIGTGPEAVDAAADLGVPCVATLHDFYTLCPTTQLLDETHRFCGGTCTPGDGWCELRGGWFRVAHPRLKHAYVGVHRAAMGRALARCAKVTAPSPSAAALVREHFPALPVEVVEYGRDLAREDVAAEPLPGERARVVFFSDLGVAKGIGAVRELLRIDREQGPRFQFHLFGGRSRDLGDLAALGGIYHGPFTRDELAPKLREIRPAFSIIPSIWPETYCFTLSESWALGLPVFASALGATGDRVRAAGGGWTADPSDPAAWYGMMLHALETPGEWGRRRAEALAATFRPVRAMADDYARIYAGLIA
jgi:glycosyltransferase involved in cell wall biosynthesis